MPSRGGNLSVQRSWLHGYNVTEDEAEHVMETNVVNHQLVMLKSNQRAKEEWDKRAAVIAKNIDSLLVNCTSKQKFPLQSLRSVIDDSYCLK